MAGLSALAAPIPLILQNRITLSTNDPKELFLQLAVLLAAPVAGVLLCLRDFRAAVLGRGILWCGLIWFALIAVVDRPTETMLAYGFLSGVALLFVGSLDLDGAQGTGRFTPVALRGTLLGIIVMSVADMLALGFLGFITLGAHRVPTLFLFGGAAAMALVVWGLLRLASWAFVLNVLANVGIAGGAWAYVTWDKMPEELALCLTATAIGQLLAGAPLAWRMLRGGANAAPGLGQSRFLGAALVVAAMVVLAARWAGLP